MVADRTWGGLIHPQKIEDMDRALTNIIEDFDRAVNVEALRQVMETSKRPQFSIRPDFILSRFAQS